MHTGAGGASDAGLPEVDHAAIVLYRWTLVQGGLAPSALPRAAAETGLTEEECRAAVRSLTDTCLLRTAGDGWQAVSPQAAGAHLLSGPEAALRAHEEQLRARREELQNRRDAFTGLIPVYLQARQHVFPQGTIDHLPDQFAVRALLTEVIDGCRAEILVSKHGGSFPEAALREALPRDLALLERGVRMRSLYQHATRFDPVTRAHAERLIGAGAEIRTLPEVLPQMIVIDGELGFLPSRSGGALLIREPDLLGYLLDVFHRDWEYATPFATGPQAAHDISETVKQSILALLAKGLKDDTIARRLAISLRTCRRHVSELLLQLGANSRFQAGVIAERQGLTQGRGPAPERPSEQGPEEGPEQRAEQGAVRVPAAGAPERAPASAPAPRPAPASEPATTPAPHTDGPARPPGCPGCGRALPAAAGGHPAPGRPARHCSASCRARAYRARRRSRPGGEGPTAGA
ncbi:helix-turn-helix transcriptional regulator [Streptomyces sp. NRRL F-2580]|uniref:helix-turn-helix transcriptional regulator n=1 Tax=Streptomyces sp. NRRL F-2580 TaxID=1463841 RepID=UPI00069125EE|nr:LuxR C-terminal-related transcriptional regulator [Streptomyces sp. NRRL F-2580]